MLRGEREGSGGVLAGLRIFLFFRIFGGWLIRLSSRLARVVRELVKQIHAYIGLELQFVRVFVSAGSIDQSVPLFLVAGGRYCSRLLTAQRALTRFSLFVYFDFSPMAP